MKMPLSQTNVMVLPLVTFKWGPDTAKQAIVMKRVREHISPRLAPPILWQWDDGYVMPTYKNIDKFYCSHAERKLSKVWEQRENVLFEGPDFDPEALVAFLEQVESDLLSYMPSKSYLELYYGHADEATHGDCTAENVVGSYVFLDWQWQRRPFIPAHRAVDYGKMLQSLLGWEILGKPKHDLIKNLLQQCPDAWFWCGVHLERILKRTNNVMISEWCVVSIERCIEFGRNMKRMVYR